MFILYISAFLFSFLQAILLNLLLRNYLHFNLYDQVQRNKKQHFYHVLFKNLFKCTVVNGHLTEMLAFKCCQSGKWGMSKKLNETIWCQMDYWNNVHVILRYQVVLNYLPSFFFLISTFYFPETYFIFAFPKFPKFLHLATSYHTLLLFMYYNGGKKWWNS